MLSVATSVHGMRYSATPERLVKFPALSVSERSEALAPRCTDLCSCTVYFVGGVVG